MKKPPPSLFALVIGLLLGFLISRGTDGSDGGKDSGDDGTAGNQSMIPRRPDASSAPGSKKQKKTSSRPGSVGLKKLLSLTSTNHGAPPTREFFDALDALEPSDISLLLAELADMPGNDPRTYKIRNSLYSLWAQHNPEEAWVAAKQEKNANILGAAISSVMGEIASNDLARAQVMLEEIENEKIKQSALYAIINSASSKQPELVFDLLNNKTLKSNTTHYFHSLFSSWARDNPDAAIARLADIKNPQQKQRASGAIALALAASDPSKAITFAMGIENASERNRLLGQVAAGIANEDPHKAIALLDEQTNRQARRSILSNISSSWLQTDPDAAMVWIKTLTPIERTTVMEQGMWQFIHSNVEKAAELLSSLPPGNRNSHYYSNLASQWAQTDPKAALQWVENLPVGASRTQAMNGVIGSIATQDPQLAAKYFEKEGNNQNTSNQVGTIVTNWVKTDQAAAIAWMNGLDLKGDTLRSAISSTVSQWAHQDGEAAAEFVMSLDSGKAQGQAINSLMAGWDNNDPEGALAWAETNLEGDMRNRALNSLIQNMTHNDYLTAVEMYDKATANLPQEAISKDFANATSQIVSSWSQHDPQGASEWLMNQPESDQRSQSVRSMVDNWGNYDVDGAAKFVLSLDEGKERDGAIQSLVRDVRNSDPEAAFLWAESVGDESKRTNLIRQSAQSWKDTDPEAARAAVSAANLPDQAKKTILKSLGN